MSLLRLLKVYVLLAHVLYISLHLNSEVYAHFNQYCHFTFSIQKHGISFDVKVDIVI